MSLSWRDRLLVTLSPDGVRLRVRPRGLRSREETPRPLLPVPGLEPKWRGAVSALRKELDRRASRGALLEVCVSDHFVRYALVSGASLLRNEAERAAAATHRLKSIYGDDMDAWRASLASGGTGDVALAAAIECEFLDALRKEAAAASFELASVEPLLVRAFNQVPTVLARSPMWLVVHEQGRVTIAFVRDGSWRKLRTQHLYSPLPDELITMLERVRLTEGVDEDRGKVLVLTREPTFARPAQSAGWTIEWEPLRC